MKKSRKILAFALSLAVMSSTALPALAAAAEETTAGNPGLWVNYYTVSQDEPWALEPENLTGASYVD